MSVVSVKWIESKLMLGVDSNGTTVTLSSAPEREPVWRGVKPSDMLLVSAASCSMYDVVAILGKQREPLEDLEVTCTGDEQENPIARFVSIHLHYVAKGKVDPEKLKHAIQLSQEKYCSVINTLKGVAQVTYDYEVQAA
jgi:putative redox protein